MKSFYQDSKQDLMVDSNGILKMSEGLDAYTHIIADAVRTLEGELQLDTIAGIPYERTIWTSAKNVELWKHYVVKRVQALDFVDEVVSIKTELVGTELSYELTVRIGQETVVVRRQQAEV